MKTEHIRIVQRILGGFFVETASQTNINTAFHSHAQAIREKLDDLVENQTIENVISLLRIATEAHLDNSTNPYVRDIFTAVHIYLWQLFTTEPLYFIEALKKERDRTERELRLKQREHNTSISPQKLTAPKSEKMATWTEKQNTLKTEIKQLTVTVQALSPFTLNQENINVCTWLNDFTQKTQQAFLKMASHKDIPTLGDMLMRSSHRPRLFQKSPSDSSSATLRPGLYENITSLPNIPQPYVMALQQEFISYLSAEQRAAEETIDLINQDFGALITNPTVKNWRALAIHLNHTGLRNFEHSKKLYHVLIDIIKNPPVIEVRQKETQMPEPSESKKRKKLFDFSSRKKAKSETIEPEDNSAVIGHWQQQVKQKINGQATSPSVSIVQVAALHQNVTVRKNKKPETQLPRINL